MTADDLPSPRGRLDYDFVRNMAVNFWPQDKVYSPCVFWTSPLQEPDAANFVRNNLNGNGVIWGDIFNMDWIDNAEGYYSGVSEFWIPVAMTSAAFSDICTGTAYILAPQGVDVTTPMRPDKQDNQDSPNWNAVEFNTLTRNPLIDEIIAVPANDLAQQTTIWNKATQGPYGQPANFAGRMVSVGQVRSWTIAPRRK